MDFSVVDAEPRHIESLETIERECFSMPWTREQLESQLPDDRHVFLVAEAGGEAVGYVGMMHILDEGYISNVAVAAAFRRNGVGDALIVELLRRAIELGLSFVTLEVREHNTPAMELYKKHGFIPVGKRKDYYEQPKEDAVLMTNFLK